MKKNCVFNNNKLCNDCKECELCELDRKKICNNCGKCLELEGYDVRAIKIEEVFEKDDNSSKDIFTEKVDLEDFGDFDVEEYDDSMECEEDYEFKEEDGEYLDVFDNEEGISYIDDIEEVRELIESGENLPETFPGLISFDKYTKK